MELSVSVNEDLYERLANRAERHGFDSPEDYSAAILQTVIDELEPETTDEAVSDRLSDLGYID